MNDFFNSSLLMFMLLNPFLLQVYLNDLIHELSFQEFSRVLVRASFISIAVFSMFALVGDRFFRDILQAEFASFQIFGGIVFLIIGVQFVFRGTDAVRSLRGKPEHIVGSIAMPIMIGPGTVSASILAGNQLVSLLAVLAIFSSVMGSIFFLIVLKYLHDIVKPRNERLIDRYSEITGRITALIIGTFSIDMIMQGLKTWIEIALKQY